MTMTPDARRALSTTIRALRARLIDDLHAATESAWRLSIKNPAQAGLDATAATHRARFEAAIDEHHRARARATRTPDDHRRDIERQAAYTLTHRLVLLRLLEAPGPTGRPLRAPALVTGGWNSRAYQDFRQLAPELVRDDPTEGYALLLRLVFDDLARDLPGLYASAGVAELVPIPPATLRHVIDALDAPELAPCWTDDMTLGWIYQYWNDPAREALDEKLNAGGKIEPHEIASKTQMFTERYMVDWLLQNSLGPLWLAICARNDWTPEVIADGTLDRLETRRADWRAARAAGEVALTDLMPLTTDAERRWAYHLRQPLPQGAPARAPATIRDLQLLDPAVGSGHFLVAALDLLVPLYREEARHRRLTDHPDYTDRAIVERILAHNLHGIDLDPRAVQIAAAALWLKARHLAPDARPGQLNLVAANLRLASLPDTDPALVELRREVERETGIPAALTDTVIHALRGADHLGSLLRVDAAVEAAIDRHEGDIGRAEPQQGGLFTGFAPQQTRLTLERAEARARILDRLDRFLAKHTAADDLGLRLRGAQLAAGVRFVRMVRAGRYDIVVANPPYQGTSRLADAGYVQKAYPLGKADLYAAFLLRGLELVKPGGVSAMLTMRNWMFIKQYAALREHLLGEHGLRRLGDFDRGAFEDVPDEVVSVAVSIFAREMPAEASVALCPTPRDDTARDAARTLRKRAATLCHEQRHDFDPAALKVVPEWPLVYWWSSDFLALYARTPLVGNVGAVRQGLTTSNNDRFVRFPWEPETLELFRESQTATRTGWVPYIKGARGLEWLEPVSFAVDWRTSGLGIKVLNESLYGSHTRSVRSEERYFSIGTAFTTMGSRFGGRSHRFRSICDAKGRSVYGLPHAGVTCLLNSRLARQTVESLNPTVDFSVGDVNRLPMFHIDGSHQILAQLDEAFTHHESHREPSVEYRHPGPSPWRHAQAWAQLAVDRPDGAPLPEYTEQLDPEPPTDHLSHALGVALGRFSPTGQGLLDPATADLTHALPHGILFLDGTLPTGDDRDGLGHPASAPLHAAWATHGPAIGGRRDLRGWLAHDFFKDMHRGMYDNRPIHWPLSSTSRTFVAWVNIHRMTPQTLPVLLADHLMPTSARIDGELADLRTARDGADARAARAADKQYTRLQAARDELAEFIAAVQDCADRGPPPTDARCPPRAADARHAPVLDDGVMINSAALWPLLAPQWKDPRKWWKELATAAGRRDFDWSQLAMRHWPDRVDAKCQTDPSLAVAHGCFWRYHPARAWAWELRLQDEIAPDFRITEPLYRPGGRDLADPGDAEHRARWLREHPDDAIAAIEREATRRMGRGHKRQPVAVLPLLEAGLWTRHPALLWAAEDRLAIKQGAPLRIEAPDEATGRAAYLAAHPDAETARAELLARLQPLQLDGLDGTDGIDDEDIDDIDAIDGTDDEEDEP